MLEYNVCYSLDSNYTEQLAASISSILKNSDADEHINFYILDGGLTKQDKTNIELLQNIKPFNINYVEINSEDFVTCPMLKDKEGNFKNYHVTLPTYYRFKLSSLLKNLDKILYLDCDVIVRKSLKDLYKLSMEKYAALMVLDSESKREAERLNIKEYFNAGVMLINLDYWRKNKVEKKLFDYAKNNADKILWQDQDVINVVLANKIKSIDNKWNFQYFQYENINVDKLPKVVIFHLAGRFKPWLMAFEHSLYDIYYYYLGLTAYKTKIIKYKENASGKTLKNNIGGSVTNILVNATQEDIQKIYSEISKNYTYTNSLSEEIKTKLNNDTETIKANVTQETDDKISKVYEEINKNYEYTSSLSESVKNNINQETDDKISKVYEEVSKNYEYTNALNEELKERLVRSDSRNSEAIEGVKNELTQSTDDKIGKVYEEISKNYEYTSSLSEEIKTKLNNDTETIKANVTQETDDKISKIYEEINKNYEYTSSLSESVKNNINQETDDKISKVYEEVSKNYEYTNALNEELKERLVRSDSRNSEAIEGVKNELTQSTEDKIGKVYEEISKNYEYTNFLSEEIKTKLNNDTEAIKANITQETDDKISKVYEEISKNYEYTSSLSESVKNNINQETDDKISKVYEEVSKNYDYTNALNEELKGHLLESNNRNSEAIEGVKNELTQSTDDKIGKVYEEISKNYEYTNSLSEEIKTKLNNDTEAIKANVTQETDDKISKVYEEVSKNYGYTEKLVRDLDDKTKADIQTTNKKIIDTKNDLNIAKDNINDIKNTFKNKTDDIYSYSNEQFKNLFNEISENQRILNDKILFKSIEAEKKIDSSFDNIKMLNDELKNSTDFAIISVNDKINNLEAYYQKRIVEIQNIFKNELNSQRIKYEKKLTEMENIISSLDNKYEKKKISLFDRLIKNRKK